MVFIKKILSLQKKDIFYYAFVLALVSCFVCINCCAKSEQNRYVYIVGGAYKGERIDKFKEQNIYSAHSWEIFAIEANPYVIDKIPKAKDVSILNRAIWIKDGTIKFYFSPQDESLSSIYKKNYDAFYETKYGEWKDNTVPIFIASIDFSQWLKNKFDIKDYIIVSFDIEGAEYDVLKKMLKDNTIQYIDYLLVEVHPGIGGKSEKEIKELLSEIKKSGIRVERVNIKEGSMYLTP